MVDHAQRRFAKFSEESSNSIRRGMSGEQVIKTIAKKIYLK